MKITRSSLKRTFSFSWRDLLVSAAILLCATGACALLHQTADTIDGFASPVYVLAVLLISRFTSGYLFGLIAAVLGVIGVNYVWGTIKALDVSRPPSCSCYCEVLFS